MNLKRNIRLNPLMHLSCLSEIDSEIQEAISHHLLHFNSVEGDISQEVAHIQ